MRSPTIIGREDTVHPPQSDILTLMTDQQELGLLIRELRLKKGMSLGQLASAVSRSSSSVRRWERGEIAPAATVLPELAAILDVDPAVLDTARARAPVHADTPPPGSETSEGHVSTIEQPIVEDPPLSPPEIGQDARTASSGGRSASVWRALSNGRRSWIGWIRGVLTLVALLMMLFVLIWAIGELLDAVSELFDSLDVGSSGDPNS